MRNNSTVERHCTLATFLFMYMYIYMFSLIISTRSYAERASAQCQLLPLNDHVPYFLLGFFQVASLLGPPQKKA